MRKPVGNLNQVKLTPNSETKINLILTFKTKFLIKCINKGIKISIYNICSPKKQHIRHLGDNRHSSYYSDFYESCQEKSDLRNQTESLIIILELVLYTLKLKT